MPNQHLVNRAKRLLTKYGYTFDVVERRLFRNITRDFCGFADLLAFRSVSFPHDLTATSWICGNQDAFRGILALQICNYGGFQEHLRHLTLGDPSTALTEWLLCGNRCEIWAYPSPRDGVRKPPKFRRLFLATSNRNGNLILSFLSETELEAFGYCHSGKS